jgi:hypothetical protein
MPNPKKTTPAHPRIGFSVVIHQLRATRHAAMSNSKSAFLMLLLNVNSFDM